MHRLIALLVALQLTTSAAIASEPVPPPNWVDVPIENIEGFPNRQVIKVDRANRRVYLFGVNGIVKSYPVAIGKKGWETPVGTWHIRDKIANPAWKNFKTRKVVPPGANNPMGSRWIGFYQVPNSPDVIGFHGTRDINSIGKAASHGCVRMRDADVRDLFDRVAVGTRVIVR